MIKICTKGWLHTRTQLLTESVVSWSQVSGYVCYFVVNMNKQVMSGSCSCEIAHQHFGILIYDLYSNYTDRSVKSTWPWLT